MKESICKTCMFLTMCRTGQDVINRREIALLGCSKFKKQEPKTNADRIRAMTDEELAEYLDGVCHDLWQMFVKDPKKMWLEWLKQEAAE